MRFVSLLRVLWMAVACAIAAPALAWAEPLATRQTAFSIPFHVDPPQQDAQRPVEVLLYVSSDRGQSWKLAGRVRPDAAQFVFRAERDGEYWFLVRTKDPTGRLLPDRAATPEMQVVVDTSQPTLELNAVRGAAGEVTVKWQSADPLLEPQNLRIDYQATGAADLWQALALDAKKIERTANSCRGELTWWPTAGSEPLTVRAEITDRAGNRTITQAQVGQPKATPTQPTPTQPPVFASTAPFVAAPVAIAPVTVTPNAAPAATAPSPGTPGEGWGDGSPRASPINPTNPYIGVTAPAGSANPPPVARPVTPTATAVPPAPAATRWPANDASAPPLGRAANQSPVQPFMVQRLPGAPAQPVSTTQSATRPAAPAGNDTWVQPPLRAIERGSDGRPLSSAPQSGPPATNPPPPYTAAPLATAKPVGERPLMVNSRSFELDYDLRAVNLNAVSKVELWGTADGGLHWASYGNDLDRTSPIVGSVDREGLYGFRVIVQAAGGRNELPPNAGDRPEIWVGVDVTAPACRLTQVQQGRFLPGAADRSSEVAIAWESQDAAPAERAASLAYGEQPSGPWTEFATGLEPSGHFTWTMDHRVPERIYVRLQVRDQAGNVAVTQTSEPLTLVNRPRVRVREVRPALETGERLQTYRFF